MKAPDLCWWKADGDRPLASLKPLLANGKPQPREFLGSARLMHERAAFMYEVEARVRQQERGASRPVYEFGKPYPRLGYSEKETLRHRWPRDRMQIQPQHRPAAAGCELPPPGWIDIHFWVKAADIDEPLLVRAVQELFRSEKKRLGIDRRRNSGRRVKPYPWAAIILIDRLLAGEQLTESDASNARNVLRRYGGKTVK